MSDYDKFIVGTTRFVLLSAIIQRLVCIAWRAESTTSTNFPADCNFSCYIGKVPADLADTIGTSVWFVIFASLRITHFFRDLWCRKTCFSGARKRCNGFGTCTAVNRCLIMWPLTILFMLSSGFLLVFIICYNNDQRALLGRPVAGWAMQWTSDILFNAILGMFFLWQSSDKILAKPLQMCQSEPSPWAEASQPLTPLPHYQTSGQKREDEQVQTQRKQSYARCYLFPGIFAVLVIVTTLFPVVLHLYSAASILDPDTNTSSYTILQDSTNTNSNTNTTDTLQQLTRLAFTGPDFWFMGVVALDVMLATQFVVQALHYYYQFAPTDDSTEVEHNEHGARSKSALCPRDAAQASSVIMFTMALNATAFLMRKTILQGQLAVSLAVMFVQIGFLLAMLVFLAYLVRRQNNNVNINTEGRIVQIAGLTFLFILLCLEFVQAFSREWIFYVQLVLDGLGYLSKGLFFNIDWEMSDVTTRGAQFTAWGPFCVFIIYWIMIFVSLGIALQVRIHSEQVAANWAAFASLFVEMCVNLMVFNASIFRIKRYLQQVKG